MTVGEDLYKWLSNQPLWQQDLARRLATRTQLEGDDYKDALRMIAGALGALEDGESASPPHAIELSDLPAGTGTVTGEPPRLVGFGSMHNVGAVSCDHKLSFAPHGLTVVYGPNAAGKTTYVRGLKRVCRSVDRDAEVRGNVFANSSAVSVPASAKVELLVNGKRQSRQLNLVDPPDLGLDAISVFDARCAELYVNEQNAVAYVPSALLILTRLAATQERLRQDITAQINELESGRPAFPELLSSTVAMGHVTRLAANTDIDELRRFATLDDGEKARLTQLRAVIAAAAAHTARADAQAAERDSSQAQALAQKLRDLGLRVAEPALQALRARATDDAQAKEAVELAAREFDELPFPGIGSEPWERLWRAAREFSQMHDVVFPPGERDCCPLCIQELDKDAATRMAHFEAHIQSSIKQQAATAHQALNEALEAIDERHVTECRTEFLAGLKDREAELHLSIESYLDAVSRRMTDLRADSTTKVLPILDDPAERSEDWGQVRAAHAQALRTAEDPKREQELNLELAELDAREKLLARIDEIEGWVAVLKRVKALQSAHSKLATNRVTTLQRTFSEALVSETLAGKLEEEVRKLRCEHLPIDLEPHAAVGRTHVTLRLGGVHDAPELSVILSEGEQRALSLAFFLAEVEMFGDSGGGIVVDDPVSSLDDERRAYIAERLVAEAQRRQVIVFTHDLPFMLDLDHKAEAAGIEPLVQGVWRMGAEVGRVDEHPPFTTLKLQSRIGVLNKQVEQWDKQSPPADFDEAWRRVCDFYARLRMTWERAVEERLFRGVVQRFQREVKTLALKDVCVTAELVEAITQGMGRCSLFVHDAAPGTHTSLPGRQQLAEDLAKLQAFEKQTKKVGG